MAPIPETTSGRLKAHYTGPFGTHTMTFHQVTGSENGIFIENLKDVITTMTAAQWAGTEWFRAEYAPAASNIFSEVDDWEPIVSATGVNPEAYSAPSTFLQFGGRAPDSGRRAKLYLFETRAGYQPDMRYQSGDAGYVSDIVTILRANASFIGNIEGASISWYSYANIGQNDYLTRRARRSG